MQGERLAAAIVREAARIGADPEDFATVISFETGGTFDPWQRGPTTQWGVHRGLIQMGEPQRRQFGYYEGMPIEDAVRASADYLVANGFRPGMSGAQLYATINTGSPHTGHRTDAHNGGTPGSAIDKWNEQMGGHRINAQRLLAGTYVPPGISGYEPGEATYRANNQFDALAHLGTDAPNRPNAFDLVASANEASANAYDPYESFWREFWEKMRTGVTAAAIRRATEGFVDFDFRIDPDRGTELLRTTPEMYHDMILSSPSESALQSRLQWIERDVVRQQRLQAGGWSATWAGLLAGFADPLPLAAGVASGGLGTLAQGGRAARIGYGAAFGAASNYAIDYTSQQVFDDPHANPLAAAGWGAALGGGFATLGVMFSRNPAAQDIGRQALNSYAAQQLEQAATVTAGQATRRGLAGSTALTSPTAQMPSVGGLRSVGAAENPMVIDSLIPMSMRDLSELPDEAVPRAFGSAVRFDAANQLTGSSDPLARTLGFHMFEDAAGTVGNHVTPFSANTRATAINRELWNPVRNSGIVARNQWLIEQGASWLHPIQRARMADEFDRAVFLYRLSETKPDDVNPHIREAAEAQGRLYDAFADRLTESGAADIRRDPNYMPLVADVNKVAQIDRQFQASAIEEMIALAINRAAKEALDPALVARMARGYWQNLRKGVYGIEDEVSLAMHRGDKDGFIAALNEGLPDDIRLSDLEAEDIWRSMGGAAADRANTGVKSRHTMRRTLLDYTGQVKVKDRRGNEHVMRVADFFEQNWELAGARYARRMSGAVAFAETKIYHPTNGKLLIDGIKNERDLEKIIDAVVESFRQGGRPANRNDGELKDVIDTLRYGWNRINGIQHWDVNNSFARAADRIKRAQFARLMSNMGFNQAMETWKVINAAGIRAAWSQVPGLRAMTRMVRDGKADADTLLDELSDAFGIGFDGITTRTDFRLDDSRYGMSAGGRIGQKVDTALDSLAQFTTQISLFKNIMAFQQRWALKVISQQVADMTRKIRTGDQFDFAKLSKGDRKRLANLGIGEEEMSLLARNMLDHATFDGKKIVGLGLNNWDPEAVTLYRNFMNRYVDRLVLNNDHGSLSKWMTQPVASMFIQFRSFVFGAWSKATLHAINHWDAKTFTLIMGEILFGAATQLLRQTSLATSEQGREKLAERGWSNILLQGAGRGASASVVSMGIDTMLFLGERVDVGPGPIFGEMRSSGSASDAFLGSPAGDQAASAGRFLRGVVQSARDGDPITQRDVRAGVRALPLPGNYVPFAALLNALIQDLPE